MPTSRREKAQGPRVGTMAYIVKEAKEEWRKKDCLESGLALIIAQMCPDHVFMTERDLETRLDAAYKRGVSDAEPHEGSKHARR